METKKEVLEMLLRMLENETPLIIVGLNDKRIPNLHSFIPKRYEPSVKHLGFGCFEGETEHGKFWFDAGGAMHNHHFKDGTWLGWSVITVETREVLKDLDYDCHQVAEALKELMSEIFVVG